MNFTATLNYIYNRLPCYQRIGQAAYKENLDNTLALLEHLGNPHKKFRSIHIAGTNGKGSVSHMLASIFQEAGYTTGLYTSPHLIDFRERIQINGTYIPKKYVSSFISKNKDVIERIQPSFFEITVAMCFNYFAQQQVDIAIVETGLGGRLDSTNVIVPELSIITNISFDHMHLLGTTLEQIANEKAGIIKNNCPVVIGETQDEISHVFHNKAYTSKSSLYFADTYIKLLSESKQWHTHFCISSHNTIQYKNLTSPLIGNYQQKNIVTVCAAIELIQQKFSKIKKIHISRGIQNTITNTHLLGRWQIIQQIPYIVCDTAHNVEGIRETMQHLQSLNIKDIHIILGVVNDKDVHSIINLLPKHATYYITKPSIDRAMPIHELSNIFKQYNIRHSCYKTVKTAYNQAIQKLTPSSILYIGGSTFVVADIISYLSKKKRKKI